MKIQSFFPSLGLMLDAISSSGTGKLENKLKFNGKELHSREFLDGTGLEWQDFGARMYDQQLGRWMVNDPMSEKMCRISPYAYTFNNPVRFTDPNGMQPADIIVTTKGGKHLFTLNDGRKEISRMTAQQLYDKGIQWFEPLADNYMPMKNMNSSISSFSELKHFTWDQIDQFASVNRPIYQYRSGGKGDWKKSSADGYLMVTVDGKPYWGDAVGQIPFAVDYFTDRLGKHGDENEAIRETIKKGRQYGDGKLFGGSVDNTNGYDIYFILRGALYAADKYQEIDGEVRQGPNTYVPSRLGERIWWKDAIPYLGIKPK